MSAASAHPILDPVQLEPESPRDIDLAAVWQDLVSHRFRVVGYGYTERYCSLELMPVAHVVRRRWFPRQLFMTEQLLLGVPQKVVALECGLAPSTVAIAFAKCLRTLGLECRMQNVPLLLAMAVHAARGTPHLSTASDTLRSDARRVCRTIQSERPDLRLDSLLPREQLAVVRLMLEGKSHREIASMRGRSLRTIANQLRQAYTKLGVGGRAGVIAWLLACPSANAAASTSLVRDGRLE